MSYKRIIFVISLLISISLYPAATPPRSYDGASASASVAPAVSDPADVKRGAEADEKEHAGRPRIVLPGSPEWNNKVRATAIAEKLYQDGTINSVDEQGYTPFQRALVASDSELAGWLVQFGAIPEWTYQGKTWQDLAKGSGLQDFNLTYAKPPHFDREVWECLMQTWYPCPRDNSPKPWLVRILQDDDIEAFKKAFRADKPVMRTVIPLLWHALGAGSLKIIRHLLTQMETLSLLPQTKIHILNRALTSVPYERSFAPVIREFMHHGYDMTVRASTESSWILFSPLQTMLSNRAMLWNLEKDPNSALCQDWLEIIELLIESGDDNVSIPWRGRLIQEGIQVERAVQNGLQRRQERRLMPQLEKIQAVLIPVDGAFNVLAPIIQRYAGIPPLSAPPQNWHDKLGPWWLLAKKQARKIKNNLRDHLG